MGCATESGLFSIRGDLDGEETKSYTEVTEFIGIVIGGEEFLLNVKSIHEIIMVPQLTYVPGAARLISGVINLRGLILPVIDMRQLFESETKPLTSVSRVVITEMNGITVGLLVDSITYVVQAKPQEIDTNGLTHKSGTSEFLLGLCNRPVGVRGILDIEKIVLKVAGGIWPTDSAEEQGDDDHT